MRPPPKQPESPPPVPDQLIGGIISLVIGIVSETILHPIVPWTFMPGVIILMIGLGLTAAVFQSRVPRWGRLGYFVILVGVLAWYFNGFMQISPLGPMLYVGTFQVTTWALRQQQQ